MVGSMGCISSLCMGISKFTNKKLFIIDGDGSILEDGYLTTLVIINPQIFFYCMTIILMTQQEVKKQLAIQ